MANTEVPPVFLAEERELEEILRELRAQLNANPEKGVEILTRCLSQAYAVLFPALQKLASEATEEEGLALVRAVSAAADPADPFRAQFLLGILSPFLFASSPRLRRASRRVLRTRFLAVYPEETVEFLVQLGGEPDPKCKVLAAQILSHVPPKLARRALIALKQLAHAEDKTVRRAVAASLRRLAKIAPGVVQPELTRWEADPVLASLIRKALDGQKLAQSQVQKE